MLKQPILIPVRSRKGEPRDMFQSIEDWTYEWEHEGEQHRYFIPKGKRTDGASVPEWLWSFSGIPPMGLHTAAAFPHDDLFSKEPEGTHFIFKDGEWMVDLRPWSYDAANRLFLRILKEAGVDKARRTKMFWAVQLFGWISYKRK